MQVIKAKKLLDNEDASVNLNERNGFNEMWGGNEKVTDDRDPKDGRIRLHSPLFVEAKEDHALNEVDDSTLDTMLSMEFAIDFAEESINSFLLDPIPDFL